MTRNQNKGQWVAKLRLKSLWWLLSQAPAIDALKFKSWKSTKPSFWGNAPPDLKTRGQRHSTFRFGKVNLSSNPRTCWNLASLKFESTWQRKVLPLLDQELREGRERNGGAGQNDGWGTQPHRESSREKTSPLCPCLMYASLSPWSELKLNWNWRKQVLNEGIADFYLWNGIGVTACNAATHPNRPSFTSCFSFHTLIPPFPSSFLPSLSLSHPALVQSNSNLQGIFSTSSSIFSISLASLSPRIQSLLLLLLLFLQ